MYAAVKAAIFSWDEAERADTYAVQFSFDTVYSADASGREIVYQGCVTMLHNTETHFRSEIARASWEEEARWNSAFWLAIISAEVPRLPVYGEDPDPKELALRDTWCADRGILPDGHDGTRRPTYDEPSLYRAVASACKRVAQAIHERGLIVREFGRPIPVLIWGDVATGAVVEVTREANPTDLSQGFEEFMLGRTYVQIAAHEELLREVGRRPLEEQAEVWAEALVDITFEHTTPMAVRLRTLYPDRSKYDRHRMSHAMREALVSVGTVAVPTLLPLIEYYALKQQFNDRNSAAWESDGAYTRDSQLATDLLEVLNQIGAADDEVVLRLWRLLDSLYQESKGKGLIGWNLMLVAHTLHVLRPDRYPDRVFGSNDNQLLNWHGYGLA